ncbi:MAG: penicillin-binding protein 2 [Patescibacteria group bacterium]|nr:penicillin-binding protein 2 [Patescibacteria group bacterium]
MKKWRIITVIGIFGVAYIFLISNLYNIQFNKKSYYEEKAEAQQRAANSAEPTRGGVYFTDKNGNSTPAILNKEFPLIYMVPKEIKDAQNVVLSLEKILDIPAKELKQKLNNPKSLYAPLSYKNSQDTVNVIKSLNIKGVYVKNQLGRFYPSENIASHLLGFTSLSDDENDIVVEKGKYGVESYFNNELAGEAGEIKGDKIISALDGKDLNLTIDRTVEAQAEEILKKLIGQWEAEGGSVIVQEPKTGKILAMGSYPDFNPNNYSKYEIKNFINPVTQLVYEPGSIFKLITMAAGIDSGKITPDTQYVDTGSFKIDKWIITNWDHKAHGKQTMTGVIEQSINTGTIFAEKIMGHDIFKNYVKKFGFGESTGIQLPGELKGNISSLSGNNNVNFATASYGQGVAVTPIQMIGAVSAIANGGIIMKPLILENAKSEMIRRVISEDTARKVTQMMVSAVKKNVLADIPNYNIAGKTGTAFIPNFQTGGYTDRVINTYVGFAPAYNPKFSILIKLEKPKGTPLAGQTVVPAFRELAQFLLNYYNISPDRMSN